MPVELLIHNFGYVCSGLIAVALGFFVLFKDPRRRAYLLFFLMAFSYALYVVFYLLAVNIPNTHASSIFAFLMIIGATAPCLNAHLAFATFNLEGLHKKGLAIMYISLATMYVFFAGDPNRVRLLSKPKEYFPNFFIPGPYYWIYFIFFFVVMGYFFSVLIKYYRKADAHERNRLKYFFGGFAWAYTWSLPIYMMILNIPMAGDMMLLTPLIGLYTIPVAYGVYKYDLLNINIAIKNALLYGFFIVFVGGSIIAVNLLNSYLAGIYTNFPIWILPISSAVLVLLVSVIIWNQLRQADLLKYEFINNISHKFRTPLTHIRWIADEFRDMNDPAERAKAADQIQFASMRLFELTSVVINASKNTNDLALYRFGSVNLPELIKDIDKAHRDQVTARQLKVEFKADAGIESMGEHRVIVKADKARLQFAFQILFENAIIYTPVGGSITISISNPTSSAKTSKEVLVSFKDTGIGIGDADLPHVFSKFFRAVNARHTDTEGMGIGLYIAKDIIEKHKGRIWVESDGVNKGSTFTVALPLD